MPSGVVFVAILVIWAAILAPQAVKLYERSASERSPQRFKAAMAVLGSGRVVSRVSVETAKRAPAIKISRRGVSDAALGSASGAGRLGAAASAGKRAVKRRQQIALGCAALLGIIVALVVAGLAPAFAVVLGALPLVSYLGLCAVTARLRLSSRLGVAASESDQVAQPRSAQPRSAERPAAEPETADGGTAQPVPRVVPALARRSIDSAQSTQALHNETEDALAATYESVEEQLGLDRYVASPSDVDGQPYLRAANE